MYLYIAGILFITASGVGVAVLDTKNTTGATAQHPTNIVKYDNVSGNVKNADVTYITTNPVFSEQTMSLKNQANKTILDANIISYDIQTHQNENFSISIDKNKNVIALNGLTPKDKITITQNDTLKISSLPADWSGKLRLNNDIVQISDNLCFKLIRQNITACYAQPNKIGGVS
jgi:hypothetical protein